MVEKVDGDGTIQKVTNAAEASGGQLVRGYFLEVGSLWMLISERPRRRRSQCTTKEKKKPETSPRGTEVKHD